MRHTPSDGSVVVEAGVAGEDAYVSVADGGGGVPPELLSTDLRTGVPGRPCPLPRWRRRARPRHRPGLRRGPQVRSPWQRERRRSVHGPAPHRPQRVMRVLVTGGAGFIGTPIVDAARRRGPRGAGGRRRAPRRPRVDPGPYLDGAEVTWADLADPDSARQAVARRATRCATRRPWSGWASTSPTPSRYVHHNDLGTAVAAAGAARAGFRRPLVLASSMVVYGEGRYDAPRHGDGARRSPPSGSLDAGQLRAALPVLRRPLAPGPRRRGRARSIRATSTPRPSSTRSTCAPAYERSTRRPRSPPSATTTSTARGCPATRPTPAWPASSAARSSAAEPPEVFEDGGQTPRLRPRPRRRPGQRPRPHDRQPPSAGRSTWPAATPHTILDMATALAGPAGLEPKVVGGYRLGDVRHIVASPGHARDLLGFTAQVPFAEGCAPSPPTRSAESLGRRAVPRRRKP